MNTLSNIVKIASKVACIQDATQLIGRINGRWVWCPRDDEASRHAMQEPVLRVFGDGLRVLETMQDLAGMDANQDWMQGSKWTLIDGSVITVNGSHVDITD